VADSDIDLCSELMDEHPVTLAGGVSVMDAIGRLLAVGAHHLPVVDPAGRLLGVFGASHAVRLLLPHMAALDAEVDLSFAHETLADMQGRLGELADRPVAEVAERDAPTVQPDTPLIRGLQLLLRTRTVVPVVDPSSRRLLGVLAYRRLLEHLRS
jgi:CBS domain-containing protein